jgi:hypothetical protein
VDRGVADARRGIAVGGSVGAGRVVVDGSVVGPAGGSFALQLDKAKRLATIDTTATHTAARPDKFTFGPTG